MSTSAAVIDCQTTAAKATATTATAIIVKGREEAKAEREEAKVATTTVPSSLSSSSPVSPSLSNPSSPIHTTTTQEEVFNHHWTTHHHHHHPFMSSLTTVVVTPQQSTTSSTSAITSSLPSSTSTSSSSSSKRRRRRMETAMDVLTRALQGDAGAQRFLDQTASIYVLDATRQTTTTTTTLTAPKLFGCWNFLHQALNEMENEGIMIHHNNNDNNNHNNNKEACQQQQQQQQQLQQLQQQQQLQLLLAQFAVKVARRSNQWDQHLVRTCMENYIHNNNTSDHRPSLPLSLSSLIPDNAQLREIVMGRIAALALDPNNHQQGIVTDNTSLQTFHQSIAANAVSNSGIRHLLLDWIIPSQQQLPPYSWVCLVQCVAQEVDYQSSSSSSLLWTPAGTRATLQQCSASVCTQLLGPVLQQTISNSNHNNSGSYEEQEDIIRDTSSTTLQQQQQNHVIAATALRALQAWCQATDLSVAQVQHLCSKVKINLVEVLSDAMYSDHDQVIDALADLIEFMVEQHPPRQSNGDEDGDDNYYNYYYNGTSTTTPPPSSAELVSPRRFQQTRFIMGVADEASFRANITAQQLYSIESKELGSILEELASAISLQRFRFMDRQAKGDLAVCHCLARILTAVCQGYTKVVQMMMLLEQQQQQQQQQRHPNDDPSIPTVQKHIPASAAGGCLEFLSKCCAHSSVTICAMVLPVVTPILATEVGLATQWLPLLQRRAIIPHHCIDTVNGQLSLLLAYETSQVGYEDFVEQFRATVLKDALVACYQIHPDYYLASCTAAIEEFCMVAQEEQAAAAAAAASSEPQTSLHLEAALYCMAIVADVALSSETAKVAEVLQRCTAALARKPKSLSNPLTLKQACHFVRKYAKFYSANDPEGVLDVAADLSLYVFHQCATDYVEDPLSVAMRRESGEWPFPQAARALESLLCQNPKHFLSNNAIAALGSGWEATFSACNKSATLIMDDDRKALCNGICHVLASLPEPQQAMSLMALAMPVLGCLEAMMHRAGECARDDPQLEAILNRASSEMVVLVSLCRSFSKATAGTSDLEEETNVAVPMADPALTILHRAWPMFASAASKWSFHDSVLDALSVVLVECLPSDVNDDVSFSLLNELVAIARSVVDYHGDHPNELFFRPTVEFLIHYVDVHGDRIRRVTSARRDADANEDVTPPTDRVKEVAKIFESLLLHAVSNMNDCLGSVWAKSRQQQGNGQPAFESQSGTVTSSSDHRQDLTMSHASTVTSVGLPWVLKLLKLCVAKCPDLLLSAIQDDAMHHDEDDHNEAEILVGQAVEAAVASLLDPDLELSMGSIEFLRELVPYQQYLERVNLASCLTVGCACGQVNPRVLSKSCQLLCQILPVERATLAAALEEHFLLGNKALQILLQAVSTGPIRDEAVFLSMMQRLWRLHHSIGSTNSSNAIVNIISESDEVHEFCREYS